MAMEVRVMSLLLGMGKAILVSLRKKGKQGRNSAAKGGFPLNRQRVRNGGCRRGTGQSNDFYFWSAVEL